MSDIIKKIKLLRTIEPDAAFKESNRRVLMMQIKNTLDIDTEVKKTENVLLETFRVFLPWEIFRTAFRPVLAVFLIVGLVLGSGLSVSAAESSLPGDALYPLKLATEKIQVTLIFKEEKKTEKHVELAGKRVDEVKKVKDKTESPGAKSEKINIAVNKFKEEIESVKTNLEKIDKKTEPQKVVEIAKIIDTKTNEYQDTLQKTAEDLEVPVKGIVASTLNEGIILAEKTGDKALEVIVEKHVQGEVVLSEEEIAKRLEKKIEKVEDKVIKIEEKIAALGSSNLSSSEALTTEPAVEPAAEPTNNEPTVSPETQQVAAQAQETTNQAKEILTEAKELLVQNDLSAVLDKVIETKELVNQAEQIVTQVAEAAPQTETENVEANVNVDINAEANVNTAADTNTGADVNVNENTDANSDENVDSNTNQNTNNNIENNINSNTNTNTTSNTNINTNVNTAGGAGSTEL